MSVTKMVRGWISGRVQGVGFRWHVRDRALERGVTGYAVNLEDGRVEVLLQGPEEAVRAVQVAVELGPDRSRVDKAEWQAGDQIDRNSLSIGEDAPGRGFNRFTIG